MSSRQETRVSDPARMTFGARLRHERERRKISIASIAENTKILGALLEGVEHDDVSRWPTGFYRKAFMRAYASAIGLDPEKTVKEFLEHFPDPAATTRPALATVSSPAGAAATSTAARGASDAPVGARMTLANIRLASPRLGAWFAEGPLVKGFGLRCLAAAFDLFAVCVLGVALYAALGMLWAPLSIGAVAYYAGSILLLGNTPGVCLFADPEKTLKKRGRVYLQFLRHATPRDIADSAV
jgi:transcriptional regulator with XRE-family HTH domain